MRPPIDLHSLPWLAATLSLGWRLAAPFTQRAELRAGAMSSSDYRSYIVLAGMGGLFLLLGVGAQWTVGSRESRLFALYAALAALHWGGPLTYQRPVLVVYFLLSAVLASTVLFQFVWLFPPRPGRRDPRAWLYLPSGVAAVAGAVAAIGSGSAAASLFGLLQGVVPGLFTLAAIVVVVGRTVRGHDRERYILLPLAMGLALGVLPYLGVSLWAGGEAGPVLTTGANLGFVMIPLGGFLACLRSRGTGGNAADHSRQTASATAAG